MTNNNNNNLEYVPFPLSEEMATTGQGFIDVPNPPITQPTQQLGNIDENIEEVYKKYYGRRRSSKKSSPPVESRLDKLHDKLFKQFNAFIEAPIKGTSSLSSLPNYLDRILALTFENKIKEVVKDKDLGLTLKQRRVLIATLPNVLKTTTIEICKDHGKSIEDYLKSQLAKKKQYFDNGVKAITGINSRRINRKITKSDLIDLDDDGKISVKVQDKDLNDVEIFFFRDSNDWFEEIS